MTVNLGIDVGGTGIKGAAVAEDGTLSHRSERVTPDAVSPSSSRTRARSPRAMRTGAPSRRTAPATSRKASSTLICSTRSLISQNIAMTRREYAS